MAMQMRAHQGLRQNVRVVVGVTVLWLPLSMLFNALQSLVLPVVVLEFVAPGEKGTVLGLILFVGLAAGAAIQPLAGSYSDRLSRSRRGWLAHWGRRQPIILLGTLLTLVLLACFAAASSLWMLAFAYVGVTVAAGMTQAGFQGLLPDFVPARLRGTAAGVKGALELFGSVLGFSVAGMLLKQGRLADVAVAIGLVLLGGTVLSLALVREGTRLRHRAGQGERRAAGAPLAGPEHLAPAGPITTLAQHSSQERLPVPELTACPGDVSGRTVFARVLACRFLFMLGVYGIGHFLLYYLKDRLHLVDAAGMTGLLLTLFTLETALVALSGGALSDRLGRLPLLWLAAGLSAAGVLLLIPATSVALIVLGGSVMSIGSGLFASANWALTADLTPQGAGGRFFGVLALATGGAAALAGLFGPLVDAGGYTALFLVTALTFAGSAVVLPRAAQIAHVTTGAAGATVTFV
jgi:MFS family permease